MIKIGLQDLENIFKNTRIRFQQENKQSDDKYLDILLDEIQNYFNHLNTFEFDDKVLITNDKILSLKKYLYTLTSISDGISMLYKKNNEIINELNKLMNINIYERNTIIKKLDKIHNFIVAHTITSEQNVDFSIYFRENFNDNSMQDNSSDNIEIDSSTGILKLKSDKKTVRIIDINSVKISLTNKEELGIKNTFGNIIAYGNMFPVKEPNSLGDKLSISDLYDTDNSYFGKSETELKTYMTDDETGNQVTACPFELVYTNPISEIDISTKLINQDEGIDKLGKIEIKKDYSFLTKYTNTYKLQSNIPEVILEFNLLSPTPCNFLELKFDNTIPSLSKSENGYVKGFAYDDTNKKYKIVDLDPKNNNANFPLYRIYWGQLINLKRLEVYFKIPWKDVPINMLRWDSKLIFDNISMKKVFFTEKFDHVVYNKVNMENLFPKSLVLNLQRLSTNEHGKLV